MFDAILPGPPEDELLDHVRDAGYPILRGEPQRPQFEVDLLDLAGQLATALAHQRTNEAGHTVTAYRHGQPVTVTDPGVWDGPIDQLRQQLRAAVDALVRPDIPEPQLLRICHNNNRRDAVCFGYQPTDTVTEVFGYPVTAADQPVLQSAYDTIEVGRRPGNRVDDERASAYRARRNRSLHVGDVIGVHCGDGRTRWFAVGKAAFWLPLDRPPVIRQRADLDTTPIDADRPGRRDAC